MLKDIVEKVVSAITASEDGSETWSDRDAAIRLATAVLMIDVARADHVFTEAELESVLELVQAHFEIGPEAAAELIDSAGDEADDLIGVHEFTQILHEHLSDKEKARVVALLWQIAYADGELDKYENSLILKISDLLYVSRGLVMRLKHEAAEATGR